MGDSKNDTTRATPTTPSEGKGGPKTKSVKQVAREMRELRRAGGLPPEERALIEELGRSRPRTRADCAKAPRPCVYVSCRYNLYLDVNPKNGSIKMNFPDQELWELASTCALDVAEAGGVILEEVGNLMNLTRERIRQLEQGGLRKLHDAVEDDVEDDDAR